jgi:hypothetical protein
LSDDLSKPYTERQDGGKKARRGKKMVKKTMKKRSSTSGKQKKVIKKKSVKREMDKYKRTQLERIARKNKVSLRRRDGSPKTKAQLFRSLKRKKLV